LKPAFSRTLERFETLLSNKVRCGTGGNLPAIAGFLGDKQWRIEGEVWGVQTPPPEIPKALKNRAKLNPIVKTVKNC